MGKIIGIDLGTTNSVVAVMEVRALMGQQHPTLIRIESPEHAGGDDDAAGVTGDREGGGFVDGQHEERLSV